MPKGHPTSLFVSSTCYDLSQLRSNLRGFADSVGLDAVMSEFDSFPVNPSQSTVGNCLEAVRTRADIFLLVVGSRYGSVNDAGKSITNLEFSEASAIGIPKYVFVKKDVLALLPVWKDNPDASFESVVDTPKLFEFISGIRDSGEVWVFPFEDASDITTTLRKQLSYLFSDCLALRKKVSPSDVSITKLGPKALRIAIEKPRGWEWLLFAQSLQDQLDAYSAKRLDIELGICFEEPIVLDGVGEVVSWISKRLDDVTHTAAQFEKALATGYEKAVGKPGEPGDVGRIVHLVERLGNGYEQLLDWKLKFLRLAVGDEFRTLVRLAGELVSNALAEIEDFTANLYADIEQVIADIEKHPKGTVITRTLTLTVPDIDELLTELDRLKGQWV